MLAAIVVCASDVVSAVDMTPEVVGCTDVAEVILVEVPKLLRGELVIPNVTGGPDVV